MCILVYATPYLHYLLFTVLVRKDSNDKAQLVLLDHGLYEEVPAKVRQSLCFLWKSIILNDHPSMKKYSIELGVDGNYFFIIIYGIVYFINIFLNSPCFL